MAPGLTNGSVGHIYKIIYGPGESPPMLPRAVLVKFDGYIGPTFPNKDNVEKLVPIVPVSHTWKKQKTTMTRTALPLILGYALTIHKEGYLYDIVKYFTIISHDFELPSTANQLILMSYK